MEKLALLMKYLKSQLVERLRVKIHFCSSATKRDLKKMAKYAFDEGGVDCESRNQIKKSCRHSYTLRLTRIR